MRRALVAGNWKMNGSQTMARELAGALASGVADRSAFDVAICPPFPYLAEVAAVVNSNAGIALGAQDVSPEHAGAFTGDVAAEMLIDLGCTVVLVGHSERRHGLGESDERVAEKFLRAMDAGLTPILCVGETLSEHESGNTLSVVKRQIDAVLGNAVLGARDTALKEFVLAYEPVWAIGTGLSATPEQAQEVHAGIRAQLRSVGADSDATRVLYGGSVSAENAAQLFAMDDIDGGLIGGASLKADDFLAICQAAGG
ncbi:MAG: triosephosphate isomerase [Gammaproteobacteria bacterium]|jgi:triosephosphate isomerase